ncbi:MAG: hypothetical protein IT168_15425 [Bryobacterales bacterium]|nr:hypothetical protein [Bryobacterales bacterium]
MLNRRDFLALSSMVSFPLKGTATTGDKPLIAFRIGTALWLEDRKLDELLEFFGRHKGAVDELVFFTSNTHPPLPLDVMQARAERLGRKVLPSVRSAGMNAGINILATMGHHSENLGNSLQTNWQRVMDPAGNIAPGVYCPISKELLDYARRIYTWMSQANPDVLWIDDDVRLMGHMPLKATCFCDGCLRRFSAQAGEAVTRERLVERFDSGPTVDRMKWRKAWLEHNRRTINSLFEVIEQATHAAKPDLPLGFMTGDRFYEGYDFAGWARTLAGKRNVEVRWRPGGGFYSDEAPLGMVEKAHAVGRQAAALPDAVKVIQSELENFPYQRLRKSARATVTEAACHMAAGTTGTAFNVLTMTAGSLEEYQPLYGEISAWRRFYERVRTEVGRGMARGVWPAWGRDSYATVNAESKWLGPGRMNLDEMYTLAEIGIPLCYDRRGAVVTALAGSSVYGFEVTELKAMLAGGCLLDVAAWKALQTLGLAGLTGVKAVEGVDRDATEVFSKDELNRRFAGWGRDCRQSFWWERVYRLDVADGARVLSRLEDYGGKDGGPASVAFTNELGGRTVLMGYYPWTQMHSLAKSSQMKAVCQWLSGGLMPVVLEDFAKVVVWARGNGVMVLNASLDHLKTVRLRIRQAGQSPLSQVTADGQSRALSAERAGGGYTRVTLENLAPWTIHLVI